MRSAQFQSDKGARFLWGWRSCGGYEHDAVGRLAIFEKDQDADATGAWTGVARPMQIIGHIRSVEVRTVVQFHHG
jgi:hypothetical protein